MNFIDRTGPELGALDPDTVIVLPLGSIEQHGPHLPVSTDLTVASSVASAAVEAAEVETLLLPALSYTKSDEHAWSPGTIWVSWDTLMRTLVDIGRSLATTPARRLVLLNAHGGNSALAAVACRELRREFGLQTFLAHPGLSAPPDERGLGIHGGHSETSIMLHLRPDLVKMEHARRWVPEHLADYEHIGFGKPVSFGWLSSDFNSDGVLGDASTATAAHGKELFETAVGTIASVLGEAQRFRPS
ncbi:creatininase family protein [Cryptosporangium phraense]|uniref:Creatininase family protein n=1 Tax=Cryptosporangium phraense TaxID=2593070 RepID=A0A545B2E7_9ACTN|nr:creatininase family protein [Cryptosporangium phraense]TQS47025.1 creatininase family protein [Cryptosporangium phraense]